MTPPTIDYEPCQDLRNILSCLRNPILHGPKEVGDGESLACGVAFENNRVSRWGWRQDQFRLAECRENAQAVGAKLNLVSPSAGAVSYTHLTLPTILLV